jgi:hypothetical protein
MKREKDGERSRRKSVGGVGDGRRGRWEEREVGGVWEVGSRRSI